MHWCATGQKCDYVFGSSRSARHTLKRSGIGEGQQRTGMGVGTRGTGRSMGGSGARAGTKMDRQGQVQGQGEGQGHCSDCRCHAPVCDKPKNNCHHSTVGVCNRAEVYSERRPISPPTSAVAVTSAQELRPSSALGTGAWPKEPPRIPCKRWVQEDGVLAHETQAHDTQHDTVDQWPNHHSAKQR